MAKNDTGNRRIKKQQSLELEILLGVTNSIVKSKPTNCSLIDLNIKCHEGRSRAEKMTTYYHVVGEEDSGFEAASTERERPPHESPTPVDGGGVKCQSTAVRVIGDGTASTTAGIATTPSYTTPLAKKPPFEIRETCNTNLVSNSYAITGMDFDPV